MGTYNKCPFRLFLVPTISPWVSEDELDSTLSYYQVWLENFQYLDFATQNLPFICESQTFITLPPLQCSMKSFEQYFPVMLFTLLYKMVLPVVEIESVHKFLMCDA